MEPIKPIDVSKKGDSSVDRDAVRMVRWVVGIAILLFAGGLYVDARQEHLSYFDIGVKASELLVWIAGLWSIVVLKQQLADQRHAIEQEFNWKRLLSYHELFDSVPGDDIGKAMYKIAEDRGFRDHLRGFGKAMPADALTEILTNHDSEYTMRAYLDEFEKFCGAIKCGIVDQDYAYSLQVTRVIRTYTIFAPFIEFVRKDSATGYLELEKVAKAWIARRRQEDDQFKDGWGVQDRSGHLH